MKISIRTWLLMRISPKRLGYENARTWHGCPKDGPWPAGVPTRFTYGRHMVGWSDRREVAFWHKFNSGRYEFYAEQQSKTQPQPKGNSQA